MPLNLITFKGKSYPEYQSGGNAAQFAIPFAKLVLSGDILDIGCNRKEWMYPGAMPVDPELNKFHAFDLPHNTKGKAGEWDGIFSSHTLEHINDWVKALDLWHAFLKKDGVLFLYLPDCNKQEYWRPWHNRKHVNYFIPQIFEQYFSDRPDLWSSFYVSGTDGNCGFIAYASKA